MHEQYLKIGQDASRLSAKESPLFRRSPDLHSEPRPLLYDFDDVLFWARLTASQSRKTALRIRKEAHALQTRRGEEAYLVEFFDRHKSEAFTPREKAAMELSEAISRQAPREAIERLMETARFHFSSQEVIHLTLSIRAVNDWFDTHALISPVILVIQENPAEQNLLRKQLGESHAHCRPVFVRKGEDALRLLTGPKQQLLWAHLLAVIIDIRLPHISGADLLHRIRQIPGGETLPITVMASSKDVRDIEEYQRLRVLNEEDEAVVVPSCSDALAHILRKNQQAEVPTKSLSSREADLGVVYERLRNHFQNKAR